MRSSNLTTRATLLSAVALASCAATPTATPTRASTGRVIDDSTITATVKGALVSDPTTKARDIGVNTFQGVVQLSGFVSSDVERAEAANDAGDVAGVRSVQNDLKIDTHPTTVATAIDDATITSKVKAALIGNPVTKAREIKVATSHGVVELSGFVDSNEQKETAAQVASSVQGVRGVDNQLQLKPAP